VVLRPRIFSLLSGVGYLAGPAVAGEGLADLPANPRIRVVVAGLQGLDHGSSAADYGGTIPGTLRLSAVPVLRRHPLP
jgi:hypothetical protein